MRIVAEKQQNTGEEWVGGIVSLPMTIDDPGGAFEPDCLVWLDQSGLVLGQRLQRPERILSEARACLVATMRAPAAGSPRRPSKLRVNNEKLAQLLTLEFPELEVAVGETPEVAEVSKAIVARLGVQGSPRRPTQGAATTEGLAAFYSASADLYEAAPWKLFPSDYPLLIDVAELKWSGSVLVVTGQDEDVFGWIVFKNMDAYVAFSNLADQVERGLKPEIPPHMVLMFERRAEHPPALVRKIQQRGWDVAGRHAYPRLAVLIDEGEPSPLTDQHYHTAELLSGALGAVPAGLATLGSTQIPEEPFSLMVKLQTSAGSMSVRLTSLDALDADGALGDHRHIQIDLEEPVLVEGTTPMQRAGEPVSAERSAERQRLKNQEKAARRKRRR